MTSDPYAPGGVPGGGASPENPWTSPLWGRPETIAGGWPTAAVLEPPAVPAPTAEPTPPVHHRSRALAVGATAAVLVALLAVAGIATQLLHASSTSQPTAQQPTVTAPFVPQQPQQPVQPQPTLPSAQPSQPGSAGTTAVASALVDIRSTLGYDGGVGAGTGIVLSSDGVVLTNHHVIAGATSITATDVGNGQTYQVSVLGYDRSHDIAVVKLTGASGLATAPLGQSSSVQVGDSVVGLGNAGGVGGDPTPAAGTVTALDQSITAQDAGGGGAEQLSGLIQVDADIRPGDSGGALVDDGGHVVGVITAGSVGTTSTGGPTEGYAVPIDEARTIAQQIIDGKASSTVHIGATAFLGIQVSGSLGNGPGALVAGVIPGTAAAQIGLVPGDVITAVDGHPISAAPELSTLLGQHRPGDSVSVRWTDATGASHTANATLGDGPVG